jgi:hypothetical protein
MEEMGIRLIYIYLYYSSGVCGMWAHEGQSPGKRLRRFRNDALVHLAGLFTYCNNVDLGKMRFSMKQSYIYSIIIRGRLTS